MKGVNIEFPKTTAVTAPRRIPDRHASEGRIVRGMVVIGMKKGIEDIIIGMIVRGWRNLVKEVAGTIGTAIEVIVTAITSATTTASVRGRRRGQEQMGVEVPTVTRETGERRRQRGPIRLTRGRERRSFKTPIR